MIRCTAHFLQLLLLKLAFAFACSGCMKISLPYAAPPAFAPRTVADMSMTGSFQSMSWGAKALRLSAWSTDCWSIGSCTDMYCRGVGEGGRKGGGRRKRKGEGSEGDTMRRVLQCS